VLQANSGYLFFCVADFVAIQELFFAQNEFE